MRRTVLAVWLAAVAAGSGAAEARAGGQARAASIPADTAQTESRVELIFLDVGQGDAVLVRSPEGRTALVDAGCCDPTAQLMAAGVHRLDLVVATHPHADHIGGMEAVLGAFPVGAYMDNAQPHTTATYLNLMRVLAERTDITYLEAVPRTLALGSVTLEVLPLPPPDEVSQNDRSVGLVLRFGSFTAFLSGDSERRQLTYFLEHGAIPPLTVLKAPHHGSRNGFTMDFLRATRPAIVVIPSGPNNYGHPHPEALDAYGSVAREIYRTDRDGQVTVSGYSDGRYVVRTGR